MARRKRLSFETLGLEVKSDTGLGTGLGTELRSGGTGLDMARAPGPVLPPARPAPIAQVAGDSSAQAAIAALTAELEDARASGRLLLRLDLDQIDESHIARDRLSADPQEMDDLIASIRDRGQQMPIEVTALGQGRFGLISGWRRLRALRHLLRETNDPAFGRVLALPRAPESLADAYRAMVEENEIRAGLSYYERARIAALAAEAGIYPDARAAISGLFAAASRAKRSKIGSFLALWTALDGRLRFASAISERLGLALARAMDMDASFGPRLADRLRKADSQSAADEIAVLERALDQATATTARPVAPRPQDKALPDAGVGAAPASAPQADQPAVSAATQATRPAPAPHREEIQPGIWMETTGGFSNATLTLFGPKVDGPLRARLVDWLQGKG